MTDGNWIFYSNKVSFSVWRNFQCDFLYILEKIRQKWVARKWTMSWTSLKSRDTRKRFPIWTYFKIHLEYLLLVLGHSDEWPGQRWFLISVIFHSKNLRQAMLTDTTALFCRKWIGSTDEFECQTQTPSNFLLRISKNSSFIKIVLNK